MQGDSDKIKKAYKTVLKRSDSESLIQKSRFIGSCSPAETEADAIAFIQGVKQQYKAATHYCYAYIVGENKGIIRFSDDGEPSNTAGLPILNVLQQKDLTNTCIVVTRYFGGTLLGTGGLTRAYGSSASLAVLQSVIISKEPTEQVDIVIEYSHYDKLIHSLKSQPVIIKDTLYAEKITLSLLVRQINIKQLIDLLDKLLNKSFAINISEPFTHYWSE